MQNSYAQEHALVSAYAGTVQLGGRIAKLQITGCTGA